MCSTEMAEILQVLRWTLVQTRTSETLGLGLGLRLGWGYFLPLMVRGSVAVLIEISLDLFFIIDCKILSFIPM